MRAAKSERPRPLVGKLVEISGSGEAQVLPSESRSPPGTESVEAVSVEGLQGQCIGWDPELQQYLVETFQGYRVALPPGRLAEFQSEAAESGGFDLTWPADGRQTGAFAERLATLLAEKAYCVVQMFSGSPAAREKAFREALERERRWGVKAFTSEEEAAWLGEENLSKVIALEEDVPDKPLEQALAWHDRQLTLLSSMLRPVTENILGFDNWGRTGGLLRMFDKDHWADELQEDDIDNGTVERLISFIRLRRISMFYILDGNGGTVRLKPRDDALEAVKPAELPVAANRLLLFRHDLLDYRYKPDGPSLALQAWLLQAPPTLDASQARVSTEDFDEVFMLTGPPEPGAGVAHVLSAGMRLPGRCMDHECLWSLLALGSETQSEVSPERWDVSVYFTTDPDPASRGKTNTKHGAFLSGDEVMLFDYTFFRMSSDEANVMTPEQRLVLQSGHSALVEAGLDEASLRSAAIGVFTGDCSSESPNYCHTVNKFRFSSMTNAATASRISHIFGLRGSACSFDTACSSSLVALGHANTTLRIVATREAEAAPSKQGSRSQKPTPSRTDGALVVGVRVLFGPDGFVGLGAGGFLGPHGRCLTFDSSANGFGRGEGCCGLFLRVSDEDDDLENRLASLVGTAVNQDGRSASMTAPHGPSQQSCIRDSMSMAQILPGSVSIAECHGTGTSLGDPIEVGALRGVLHDREELPLLLTSSKSNIGHAESAAGVNGFVKCVLMVSRSTAPPNVHLKALNSHLDVEGWPCYFESECTDAFRNSMHAGVSSFGFGGTNARADLWGCCLVGPRDASRPDLTRCEYVDVPCPLCRGPMCWMCGVAVPEYSSDEVHRCSLVRASAADYKYCSECYTGSYLFGEPEELDVPLKEKSLAVVGTWSAWQVPHEVEKNGPGTYTFSAALSETLIERFHFVLADEQDMALYPALDKSGPASRILGPDGDGRGRSWLIDGRRDKKPTGSVYKITLKWDAQSGEKRLEWEATGAMPANRIDPKSYEHSYYLVGSCTGWDLKRMALLSAKQGIYEANFKIGPTGEEEFQFVRDKDWAQTIHPACMRAEEESVLVRGPDDGGEGRCWVAHGRQGEILKVQLRIQQGHFTVTLNPGTRAEKAWETGRENQNFYLTGNFNRWGFAKMKAEAGHGTAGVHRHRLAMGRSGQEIFQIAIDEDPLRKMFPVSDNAGSGEAVVDGPGRSLNRWLIRSQPDKVIEVVLDTTQQDRRKWVWWHEVSGQPPSATAGAPRAA